MARSMSPSVHWGEVEYYSGSKRGRKKAVFTTSSTSSSKTILRSGLKNHWQSSEQLLSDSPPSPLLFQDEFEKKPKTDYTYSHTGTYSYGRLNSNYSSPNLSRRRLRFGYIASSESSSAYSSAEENQLESAYDEQGTSQTNVAVNSQTNVAVNSLFGTSQTNIAVNGITKNQVNSEEIIEGSTMSNRRSQVRNSIKNTTERLDNHRSTRSQDRHHVNPPNNRNTRSKSQGRGTPLYESIVTTQFEESRETPSSTNSSSRGNRNRRSVAEGYSHTKTKRVNHLYGLDPATDEEYEAYSSTVSNTRSSGSWSSEGSPPKIVTLLLSPFRYLYRLIAFMLSLDTWLLASDNISDQNQSKPLIKCQKAKYSKKGKSLQKNTRITLQPATDDSDIEKLLLDSEDNFNGFIDKLNNFYEKLVGTGNAKKTFGSFLPLILLLLIPFLLGAFCSSSGQGIGQMLLAPFYFVSSSTCSFYSRLINLLPGGATVQHTSSTGYFSGEATVERDQYSPDFNKLNNKVKNIILNLSQKENQVKMQDVENLVRTMVREELQNFLQKIDGEARIHIAQQIQKNTDFDSKIAGMNHELKQVLKSTEQLVTEISTSREKMRLENINMRNETYNRLFQIDTDVDAMKHDIGSLRSGQASLITDIKRCCKNDTHLIAMMQKFMGDQWLKASGGDSSRPETFYTWLQSDYVEKESFERKFQVLADRMTSEIRHREDSEKTQVFINSPNGTGISEEHVKLIVQEALNVYSADKTGMVDYALESAGGSIVSTRCSETYITKSAQISLFGIPLWYSANSPRKVIQPEIQPGQCWAFKGSHGYLVIQLAANIHPTAFSMEHIPKALSPTGNIASAPKDFAVWGLQSEKQVSGVHLGDYTYDQDSGPLQFFPVQNMQAGSFAMLELKILSNHGNQEYTCLYRFRVHGILHAL